MGFEEDGEVAANPILKNSLSRIPCSFVPFIPLSIKEFILGYSLRALGDPQSHCQGNLGGKPYINILTDLGRESLIPWWFSG